MALTDDDRLHLEWLLESYLDETEEDYYEEKYEAELDRLFTQPQPPEKLYLYAYHANIDIGLDEWQRIIRHPSCDQGTALLVFWRHTPGYFCRYATRDEVPNFNLGDYDLLEEIKQRYRESGFATQLLRFDPADDRGENWLAEYQRQYEPKCIPPEMCVPSPGNPVEPLW